MTTLGCVWQIYVAACVIGGVVGRVCVCVGVWCMVASCPTLPGMLLLQASGLTRNF